MIGRNGDFAIGFRARTEESTPKKLTGLLRNCEASPEYQDYSLSRFLLERELQVELHLARIQRAARLTKVGKAHMVIGAASDRS